MSGLQSMKMIHSKKLFFSLELFNWLDFSFRVIARVSTPNTDLQFQRRPARDDFLYEIFFI
jgi:hypothetical protein